MIQNNPNSWQSDGRKDLLGYSFYVEDDTAAAINPYRPTVRTGSFLIQGEPPKGVHTFNITGSAGKNVGTGGIESCMVHFQMYYFKKQEAQEAYTYVSKMHFGKI